MHSVKHSLTRQNAIDKIDHALRLSTWGTQPYGRKNAKLSNLEQLVNGSNLRKKRYFTWNLKDVTKRQIHSENTICFTVYWDLGAVQLWSWRDYFVKLATKMLLGQYNWATKKDSSRETNIYRLICSIIYPTRALSLQRACDVCSAWLMIGPLFY